MVQVINPDEEIVIRIKFYDDLPKDNYIAYIEGDAYRGMAVSASSIEECMKELAISLKVLNLYRKNNKINDQ